MSIYSAIEGGDYHAVASWLSARHEINVTVERVRAWLCGMKDKDANWSESSWDSWFRNRIASDAIWPGPKISEVDDFAATAVLHVFFITINETPEMIKLLRFDPEVSKAGPSRSSVPRANADGKILVPVDRTANSVWKGIPFGKEFR